MRYKDYKISLENNYLVIYSDLTKETYKIKVINNSEYTYKINKKTISAINGATGLYTFIESCINKKFGLCWVDKILVESIKRA